MKFDVLKKANELQNEILKYEAVISRLTQRTVNDASGKKEIGKGFLYRLINFFRLEVRTPKTGGGYFIREVEIPLSFNGKLIELLEERNKQLKKEFEEL